MGARSSTDRQTSGFGRFAIPEGAEREPQILQREGAESPWSSERVGLGQRISVLVWNLQKQKDKGFEGAFRTLARGRDLLLLQEMHLDADGRQFFHSDTEHGYLSGTSFIYLSDQSPSGVALGSKVAPSHYEAQITEDVEPIVGTPKTALFAEFPIEGAQHSLLAVTVHGINRASFEAFTKQIDLIVEAVQKHTGPVLWAGDFNTQSAQKTEYMESAAGSLGLVSVPFNPDTRTLSKLSRRPLDHAFVRGVQVSNGKTWDELGGSDHVAMTFDLEFPPP